MKTRLRYGNDCWSDFVEGARSAGCFEGMSPLAWHDAAAGTSYSHPGLSMAEKSRRRLMLEQSLADDPADSFLRYGLAIQCLREGDLEEGRERLLALIADHPDDSVAAYQQLAQSYADSGEQAAAAAMLRTGINKAKAIGDWHAAAEMEQMLDSLA